MSEKSLPLNLFLILSSTCTTHFAILKCPWIVGMTVTKGFEAIACLKRVIFGSGKIQLRDGIALTEWNNPWLLLASSSHTDPTSTRQVQKNKKFEFPLHVWPATFFKMKWYSEISSILYTTTIQTQSWKEFVNYKFLTSILLEMHSVGPGSEVVVAAFNKEILVIIYSCG